MAKQLKAAEEYTNFKKVKVFVILYSGQYAGKILASYGRQTDKGFKCVVTVSLTNNNIFLAGAPIPATKETIIKSGYNRNHFADAMDDLAKSIISEFGKLSYRESIGWRANFNAHGYTIQELV